MDCHWSHSIFKKSDVLFYSIFDHLSLIWGFFKGIYVILDIEYTLISSAFVRRIACFALYWSWFAQQKLYFFTLISTSPLPIYYPSGVYIVQESHEGGGNKNRTLRIFGEIN